MSSIISRLFLSAVLMMCCMTASAAGTSPSAGDGTKDNPYQIATMDNLLWFADYVNAGNTSACAELTADITMNAGVLDSNGDLNSGTFMEWTPLGTYEKHSE